MNHQFPGSRSPGSGAIGPFYNPQKDAPNPNNPTLYQPPPQPTLPFPASSASKSYIARSTSFPSFIPSPSSATRTSSTSNSMSSPHIVASLPILASSG